MNSIDTIFEKFITNTINLSSKCISDTVLWLSTRIGQLAATMDSIIENNKPNRNFENQVIEEKQKLIQIYDNITIIFNNFEKITNIKFEIMNKCIFTDNGSIDDYKNLNFVNNRIENYQKILHTGIKCFNNIKN